VQLIEVSMTGARSAVITLRAPRTPMRITLFPMTHLGTPDYYRSVTARLAGSDLIIAEGISGRLAAARALTLAYRLPAHSRRLGLTVQHIDYASLGIPVIRPDITAPQFRKRWRSIPLLQRLTIWTLIPVFAAAFTLLGTRRTLSRYLAADDLPTHLEEQARQATRQLTELILDHRDALLIDSLTTVHQAHHAEDIDVAVVYGAEHMPALAHQLLQRYGYRPRTAEWLTIFDL
jgi:hypothetical protein